MSLLGTSRSTVGKVPIVFAKFRLVGDVVSVGTRLVKFTVTNLVVVPALLVALTANSTVPWKFGAELFTTRNRPLAVSTVTVMFGSAGGVGNDVVSRVGLL